MGKYRFTAKKCTFEGVPGYMVAQHRADGTIAADGLTPADEYGDFCRAIGTVPELITED